MSTTENTTATENVPKGPMDAVVKPTMEKKLEEKTGAAEMEKTDTAETPMDTTAEDTDTKMVEDETAPAADKTEAVAQEVAPAAEKVEATEAEQKENENKTTDQKAGDGASVDGDAAKTTSKRKAESDTLAEGASPPKKEKSDKHDQGNTAAEGGKKGEAGATKK